MKEIIKEINLVEDSIKGYDGYEVVTDKQTISLVIDNYQSCCEQWGYFWCNDPTEFIGSELTDIKIVDTALNPQVYEENSPVYEGDVMFVNLETSVGTLQFVAYNEHNGYYGHLAKVKSESFNYEVGL